MSDAERKTRITLKRHSLTCRSLRALRGTTPRYLRGTSVYPISTFVAGADKRFDNKSFSLSDAKVRLSFVSRLILSGVSPKGRARNHGKPRDSHTRITIPGTLFGPRSASPGRTRIPGEYSNKEKRGRQKGDMRAMEGGRVDLAKVRATPRGL